MTDHRVHVAKDSGGWQSRAVALVGLMAGDAETVVIVPDLGNGNRLVERALAQVALCDEKCSICPPATRPRPPIELQPMQPGPYGERPSESQPRAKIGPFMDRFSRREQEGWTP